MERMKHTGDYELDEINMLEQECSDLEEENKRLEEENKKLKVDLMEDMKEITKLEKENRKLREENKTLKEWIDIAKGVPYKNPYNDIVPRDENGFYKEIKPTC